MQHIGKNLPPRLFHGVSETCPSSPEGLSVVHENLKIQEEHNFKPPIKESGPWFQNNSKARRAQLIELVAQNQAQVNLDDDVGGLKDLAPAHNQNQAQVNLADVNAQGDLQTLPLDAEEYCKTMREIYRLNRGPSARTYPEENRPQVKYLSHPEGRSDDPCGIDFKVEDVIAVFG